MNTKTPGEASKDYMANIKRNLQTLIDSSGYSQNYLATKITESGINLNQGTISKYLNSELEIQLSIIIKLCEIFNIPISHLADENFQYPHVMTMDCSDSENENADMQNPFLLKLGRKFIIDPSAGDFNGYLQKYYCYFYPTLSYENEILEGELELSKAESYCQATLSLNTNRKNIIKNYTGYAVISEAVKSCYILLYSANEGEMCMINMRYFFIRHQSLDCRIAAAITNGAGERHFPTIHRMLLSREPIKKEHLQYLTPHLHLNSSDIRIQQEDLEKLGEISNDYKKLIEHLTCHAEPVKMYHFKEDYVISNAKQFLSKDDARLFLFTVRNHSYKMRYNKVSNKVDEAVREQLLSMGYYSSQV